MKVFLKNIPEERTNYWLRETVLKLKGTIKKTAVLTHGANPGLVSHFVKQALLNMAKDNNLQISIPKINWNGLNLPLHLISKRYTLQNMTHR